MLYDGKMIVMIVTVITILFLAGFHYYDITTDTDVVNRNGTMLTAWH